jgi:hypothetical protein
VGFDPGIVQSLGQKFAFGKECPSTCDAMLVCL